MSAPTVGTVTTFNRTVAAYPWSDSFTAVIDATATAVVILIANASGLTFNPTVTVGGVAATFLAYATSSGSDGTCWVYGLLAPTTGATVAIAISNGSNYANIGAAVIVPLIGTATSSPFEVYGALANNSDSQTLSITTLTANDLIISGGYVYYNSSAPSTSGTGTLTQIGLATQTNFQLYAYSQPAASAGSFSQTFTATYNPTGLTMVGVKAGSGGGGVTFLQRISLLGCGS